MSCLICDEDNEVELAGFREYGPEPGLYRVIGRRGAVVKSVLLVDVADGPTADHPIWALAERRLRVALDNAQLVSGR